MRGHTVRYGMNQKHTVSYFLFFGVLGVACLAPIRSLRAQEQTLPQEKKVLAKVNGKPIYEERLQREVQDGLTKFRKYGARDDASDLVRRLQKRALDRVISEELIFQASQTLTIEDLDEKVDEKLSVLRKKYASKERFDRYLKQNKLTIEDLRSSLRARVHVEEYLKAKGISEPKLPEERIREAYEKDMESYSEEERIMVSHILLAVEEDAGAEADGQARKKAQEIHKKLLEGGDFGEMAQEHSDCNSASGGGKLGYIKRGFMPEEFDRMAFAVEKDTVSEVVRTKFGYHIIKVLDKKPARIVPYEEVRGFIERYLQEEESKKKLAAHIAELRKRAKIEITERDFLHAK